jgi:predicted  nucleic acid-binding Zn-ribbon protein
MFNALKYTKDLEAAGIPREQAEAQVQLVIAAIEDEVATKSELSEFRADMRSEFAEIRSEFAQFRSEVKSEFSDLRSEIAEMKSDLVFKLGVLFVGSNTVGFGMLGVLIAFLSYRP